MKVSGPTLALLLSCSLAAVLGASIVAEADNEEQEPEFPNAVIATAPPPTLEEIAADEAAIGGSLHATSAQDASRLKVDVTKRGNLRVSYECDNCIKTVVVERWDAIADSTKRTLIGSEVARANDGTRHFVELSGAASSPGEYIGLTVQITLSDSDLGSTRSTTRTIFGHVLKDGSFYEMPWDDWACASGQAQCVAGADGVEEIHINNVLSVTEG